MLCSGGAVVAHLLLPIQQWSWLRMWTYTLSRADYSGSILALLVPMHIVVMQSIELTSTPRSAEYDRRHIDPDGFHFKLFNKESLPTAPFDSAHRCEDLDLDAASGRLAFHFVRSWRPALFKNPQCLQAQGLFGCTIRPCAGDSGTKLCPVQSESLRPMEMVGLGRPQTCSGAQGSLQQLAKRRLRDLVESLWGGGSSFESSVASHEEMGGGSQQGDAACDPKWTGLLFSHRAVSVTVLVATAVLAFLAFWDIRLLYELVRTPHTCLCVRLSEWPAGSPIPYELYKVRAVHSGRLTAVARMQILWPWRGCMAIINWIYHSLDERCMSQRRQVAEMALRSAMKSGKPLLSII